ncbi:MAG: cation resistance protein [Candidatus Binatia bacterium]|nr:MAG: cation resistance protein [Candidatus Binatia bacterium]
MIGRRLLLVGVLFVWLGGALFGSHVRPAWAHARLLRSEPRDNAVIPAAPRTLRLWFNEVLDRGFHTVEVFSAAELKAKQRRNLVSGPPEVNPEDRTELRVPLPELAPGRYVVEYRVLSRDGHSAPGRVSFEIRAP